VNLGGHDTLARKPIFLRHNTKPLSVLEIKKPTKLIDIEPWGEKYESIGIDS